MTWLTHRWQGSHRGIARSAWRSTAKALRAAGKPVALAVLFLLVGQVDPFGLLSAADRYTRDVVYQLYAPYYGDEAGNSNGVRDDVIVVLWTENDLANLYVEWPPQRFWHAEILDRIREQKPKSLFVDFAFVDERDAEGGEALEASLAGYLGDDIPAFVAEMGPSYDAGTGVIPALADYPCIVSVPGVKAVARGVDYPQRDEGRLTAAYAIHTAENGVGGTLESWCREIASRAVPTPQRELLGPDGPDRAGMAITWTNYRSDVGEDRAHVGVFECKRLEGTALAQATFGSRLARILHAGFSGEVAVDRALRETCPPHDTVSAFTALTSDGAEFTGKHVIYGAYIPGASDMVEPPTHELIPGAYVHAMALDNLLSGRTLPRRSWGIWERLDVRQIPQLIYVAALLALTGLHALTTSLIDEKITPERDTLRLITRIKSHLRDERTREFFGVCCDIVILAGILSVYLGAAIFIFDQATYLMFVQYDVNPMNFVGLAAFLMVAEARRAIVWVTRICLRAIKPVARPIVVVPRRMAGRLVPPGRSAQSSRMWLLGRMRKSRKHQSDPPGPATYGPAAQSEIGRTTPCRSADSSEPVRPWSASG